MFDIIFSEQFEKSFSKIKDNGLKVQIWKKIEELRVRAPLGKKLVGNPYWSIHINKYRVIYELTNTQIVIADILQRKNDYREI